MFKKIGFGKMAGLGCAIMVMISLGKPVYSYGQGHDTSQYTNRINLEEVSITGQFNPEVYSRLARKVTIITKEEITSSPATSIQDMLESVASVDVRQRNTNGVQADIQLRGGSFDQVLILLNGVNVTDPQTGHFSMNLPVELSSVERIEIVHGSGARIYGANACKGIINIITKKDNNYTGAGLTVGQHKLLHTHVNANLIKENLYGSLGFSGNKSDGYTENTDYDLQQLFGQGGVNLKSADIFLQGGVNTRAFGANNFYSPSFPEQYEENLTGFSSLSVSSHTRVKLTGSLYWRRHLDHFLLKRNDPSFYENHHMTNVYGIRSGAGFSSVLGKTYIGIEDRYENIYSTVLGNESDNPRKISGTDSSYYTNYYKRNTLNSFIEHTYIHNSFSLTGGLLFTMVDHQTGETGLFPGLDISQRFLSDKLKWYGSVNRSLRLPTFTDLFYKDPVNEGNTELNPEKLVSLETGLEFNQNKITSGLTLFRDHGKDVIDWVWLPDMSVYKAMNISEIITGGIEISGKYDNPAAPGLFRIRNTGLCLTYITSRKDAGDYESKYSLDYLKYQFRIFSSLDLKKRISLKCQVNYNSRNGSYLDYDPDTRTRFSEPFQPYWLVDLRLQYSVKHFRIFTSISNLFDAEYTDVGNLIQPGRWITAGIEFSLIPAKQF